MAIHPSLAPVFAEHDAPSHCGKADAIAGNRPLLQLAGRVQQQIASYRSVLLDAETDPALPEAFRGKLESLHQGLGAADRILNQYQKAGRELTQVMVQLDADFTAAKKDMDRP